MPVEPIVSKQVWEDAQAKKKIWRQSRVIKQTHPFILRNTAFCGVCGEPMSCRPNRSKSTDKRLFYYVCSKAHRQTLKRSSRCKHTASYRADKVDADLWQDVRNVIQEPTILKEHFRKHKASLSNTDNHIKDKLVAKQKLVRKKQLAMDKLLDVYIDGSLSKNVTKHVTRNWRLRWIDIKPK